MRTDARRRNVGGDLVQRGIISLAITIYGTFWYEHSRDLQRGRGKELSGMRPEMKRHGSEVRNLGVIGAVIKRKTQRLQ